MNHSITGAAVAGVTSSPVARLRVMSRSLTTLAVIATMLAGTIIFNVSPAVAEQGHRNSAPPEGPIGSSTATPETVPASDQAATSGLSTATTTVALNLRSGPSLDAAIRQVMPAGSVVQITGADENGFYPVTYDEVSGFAYGEYLAISGDTDTVTGSTTVDASAGSGETDVVQIIYSAAAMYGQSGDDLLRVATCESGLNPNAVNSSSNASGLFQFLPSTWATTPYAGEDIFDPVANAEAAAWMWANGRRGEWTCQ